MLTVFIDGLCEPKNPGGIASYGFVVTERMDKPEMDSVAFSFYKDKGIVGSGPGMSNNVAEYTALEQALLYLSSRTNDRIHIKGDSKLVINQMSGLWRVHGGLYTKVYDRVKNLAKQFSSLSFEWIPRELNGDADSLSRMAYEAYCVANGMKPRYSRFSR